MQLIIQVNIAITIKVTLTNFLIIIEQIMAIIFHLNSTNYLINY